MSNRCENTLTIKELPIGIWTDDYKCYLETLMESNDKNGTTSYIKQYDDMSKSTNVNIKIKFNKNILPKLLKNKENLEKLLKLTTSTTNMHLSNKCIFVVDTEVVNFSNFSKFSLFFNKKFLLNFIFIFTFVDLTCCLI